MTECQSFLFQIFSHAYSNILSVEFRIDMQKARERERIERFGISPSDVLLLFFCKENSHAYGLNLMCRDENANRTSGKTTLDERFYRYLRKKRNRSMQRERD